MTESPDDPRPARRGEGRRGEQRALRGLAIAAILIAALAIGGTYLYFESHPAGAPKGSSGKAISTITVDVAGTGGAIVNSTDGSFVPLPSMSVPHNCTFVVDSPTGTDAVDVRVLGSDGSPVPGAMASLTIDQGIESFHASPAASAATDTGGVAHFTWLHGSIRPGYPAGGILLVNATAPGYGGSGFTFGEVVVDAPPSLSC
ncbi:MAG: hypothetical protein KGJ23_00395 [Euryarchaeota archaeon]|nr:hypothetical protein [Euryarchaeota archaeon]MDE1835055.1 hypothetical protein [Euryarchaeota archaeon]MDE1879326.1 hypothetical protein [Euryarchaeota archaeon]MDE2044894.1 hypothetical protein [Thermoplasmata archaeon]